MAWYWRKFNYGHQPTDDGYCSRCGKRTSELECEAEPSPCIPCVEYLQERIASLQAQVMLNRIVEQAKVRR